MVRAQPAKDFVAKGRANGYSNVSGGKSAMSVLCLFTAVSFLATPPGVWCVLLAANFCGGFVIDESVIRARPLLSLIAGSAITAVWSLSTFIPFARLHDFVYRDNPELRCQTNKSHDVSLFNRSEVRLASLNLFLAAVISTLVVIGKVLYGWGRFYFEVSEYGWTYLFASAVAYFVFIDMWAYIAHRLLHLPCLYKTVHKWHHAYKQPTAFVALALHPVDMILFQGGVFVGMYIVPLHVSAIAVNLLYIHYFNVIDHSGVYHESSVPWQATSLYHDDHHLHWHVNYGQSLTVWDRMCGTFYQKENKYTESAFSY